LQLHHLLAHPPLRDLGVRRRAGLPPRIGDNNLEVEVRIDALGDIEGLAIVGVTTGDAVGIGVDEPPGQPFRAAFTPAISSWTATVPLPSESKTGQTLRIKLASARLTPLISSSTVT
jgi:hypothetical protein